MDGIPQEVENKILSIYTDLSIKYDEQDLSSKYLYKMVNSLGINKKLLIDFQISDYCIAGTKVLDIDKLIYKLGKLVVLNDNMPKLVNNWLLILKLLPDQVASDSEAIFEYKLTVKDLQDLNNELSLSSDVINMISIFGKTSINFVEFGEILYRLKQL